MSRIGIVTLNGYFNYGNRLQNYALQETLKSFGYNVETIIIDNEIKSRKSNNKTHPLKRISNIKNKPLKDNLNRVQDKIWTVAHKKEILKSKSIRKDIFINFTKTYIKETDYTLSNRNVSEQLLRTYDFFVVGSDQVWNPSYNYGSSLYFLTFAEKNKRIAYAPSFGVSKIPEEIIDNYRTWLNGIDKLSVREDDGARIIKEITSRDVPVVVDPTLLLTKEKWMAVSKEATNKPKGKFLLTYFLGNVPERYRKVIENIAKSNNLEIVSLADIKDKNVYRTGPSEFIDYINSASILCTDSFHGCAFSILMETPFIVFSRVGSQAMFSRIDTLLNKFGLDSRKAENIKTNQDVFNIDYSNVASILEKERTKAINFLREALKAEDGVKA